MDTGMTKKSNNVGRRAITGKGAPMEAMRTIELGRISAVSSPKVTDKNGQKWWVNRADVAVRFDNPYKTHRGTVFRDAGRVENPYKVTKFEKLRE